MSDDEDDLREPLDPLQIKRINSTHRGFLYQHLVAVGAFLLAGKSGLTKLTPERDEDVELDLPDGVLYVQSKFRSAPLQPSDVKETLNRFAELRKKHASGQRGGKAEFVIFTNAHLSESLTKDTKTWPKDTKIVSPDTDEHRALPPAWEDINEALSWCRSRCAELPFSSLFPETLVWKLAA
jgi:hypothetical protein